MAFKDKPVPIGEILNETDRPASIRTQVDEVTCQGCGAPATWHTTQMGRRLLLDPRPVPAERIPFGKRWRVTEDGIAVGQRAAKGHCRIAHFDVCPARRKPAGGLLLALWEKNRERQAGE